MDDEICIPEDELALAMDEAASDEEIPSELDEMSARPDEEIAVEDKENDEEISDELVSCGAAPLDDHCPELGFAEDSLEEDSASEEAWSLAFMESPEPSQETNNAARDANKRALCNTMVVSYFCPIIAKEAL